MDAGFTREVIVMATTKIDYKAAGVDIHAGNRAIKNVKQAIEKTFGPHVLTPIGGFGAMYDLSAIINEYRQPVLVQSIDGVGTKMMVAKLLNQYDTIGLDLVSATSNDIVVLGAKPLTLLDYIANDHLNPHIIASIIKGIVQGCLLHKIALVGGETAEMPGTYLPGEHDLVGIVTGVVEKDKAILGKEISVGDYILGFASSGLHTNGYSLARKLLFEKAQFTVDTKLSDFTHPLGVELLRPHLNYTQPILHLLANHIPIKGMAHITGGGLIENIPRILPSHCAVELECRRWPNQAIFSLLKQLGSLDDEEMYRTFNMGIGLVLIIPPQALSDIYSNMKHFPEFNLYHIGEVVPASSGMRRVLCK